MVQISANFDSGNIEVLNADDPGHIRLAIVHDNQSEFLQWFHFRLGNAKGIACTMVIENAGACAYPQGWENYRAVASYDRRHWFRVETSFDGTALRIEHTPEFDSMWLAYFAPYSHEQHQNLLAEVQGATDTALVRLGQTLDGRDLDMLHFASPAQQPKKLWIIARQHPGESMAEWWMEGFLARLADDTDPVVREIRAGAEMYIVPNMNPDGSARGHLRTNACGANLNREWLTPTMERSPEVFLVRQKMQETGANLCLDVHGDEALPYNFIAGAEGTPSWSEAKAGQLKSFLDTLEAISPDFQTKVGYPVSKPGKADMTMCTNWTGEEFGGLAMTLEMPFKDTVDTPDQEQGWSPERCRHLGAAMVDAIWARFDDL